MVKRYAVVNDVSSICENVILWDATSTLLKDQWAAPTGYTAVESDTIQIGDTV